MITEILGDESEADEKGEELSKQYRLILLSLNRWFVRWGGRKLNAEIRKFHLSRSGSVENVVLHRRQSSK